MSHEKRDPHPLSTDTGEPGIRSASRRSGASRPRDKGSCRTRRPRSPAILKFALVLYKGPRYRSSNLPLEESMVLKRVGEHGRVDGCADIDRHQGAPTRTKARRLGGQAAAALTGLVALVFAGWGCGSTPDSPE